MPDTISKRHRSWVMGRIRSDNTKLELVMRSLLHRAGYRFSLRRKLPGRPDIVLPKHKAVIFVHGCFWHKHRDPLCKITKVPKSNKKFWKKKLKATAARDEKNKYELEALGWRVLTVWECEVLGSPGSTLSRVVKWLDPESSNSDYNASVYQEANVKAALTVSGARHKYILKKRTGSTRYEGDENT